MIIKNIEGNKGNQNLQLWLTVHIKITNLSYKIRKGKWKLLSKIEEITVGRAHENTFKLN